MEQQLRLAHVQMEELRAATTRHQDESFRMAQLNAVKQTEQDECVRRMHTEGVELLEGKWRADVSTNELRAEATRITSDNQALSAKCDAYASDPRSAMPAGHTVQDGDGVEISRLALLSQKLGEERITLLERITTQQMEANSDGAEQTTYRD